MEKENNPQLELFSQLKQGGADSSKGRLSFFRYMRSYEKVIVNVIILMVTGIISFSLGVEKGKRIVRKDSTAYIELALKAKEERIVRAEVLVDKKLPLASAVPAVLQVPRVIMPLPQAAQAIKSDPLLAKYSIQVASYEARLHAEKAAKKLKSKGMAASVVSKGRFSVLYVGNFSDKVSANTVLTELKKQYRDAFLRRL